MESSVIEAEKQETQQHPPHREIHIIDMRADPNYALCGHPGGGEPIPGDVLKTATCAVCLDLALIHPLLWWRQ